MRLRYTNRFLHAEKTIRVRKVVAMRRYNCHACGDPIPPAATHWAGSNGERVCFDCPEARTAR